MTVDDGTKVQGRAFPPGRAAASTAILMASDDGLRLVPEGDAPHDFARTDARLSDPVGRTSRRVSFVDGTLFETDDHAGIEALMGSRPSASLLHRSEAFSPRLIGVVAASVAGIALIWLYALPALVAVAVWSTPQSVRATIDRSTLGIMDRAVFDETALSEDTQAEIRTVYNHLLAELPENDRTRFEHGLLFRDGGGMGPNAAALPGGTVIMTDALWSEFEDIDLIAGVLGHELGHVTEQHGLSQLYRSLGIYVLVALIAGDTGPIIEAVLLEGGVLLSWRHSRQHEREADEKGVRLTMNAGYDPEGMAHFFDWAADQGAQGGWASTHPDPGERADDIRDAARDGT